MARGHRGGLAGACVVAAAGAAAVVPPAVAEQRTIVVQALGGELLRITVDVPPGTPLDQIQLPPIETPILGIKEEVPAPAPTPAPQKPAATPQAAKQPKKQRRKRKATKKRAKRERASQVQAAAQAVARERERVRRVATRLRTAAGAPAQTNPTLSLVDVGPVAIGVPNFMIDRFRIPPFLLPIYQAAGTEHGVPWQVLAAINEIETDYGRNLNVSRAGAVGWMQFLPSTWKRWGTDANRDGRRDPYNPVDAIFSAARYLKAAGADTDLRKAVFAYNHADWYVDQVLMRAKVVGGLPSDLVGALTGLSDGRFPVAAHASYADDVDELHAARRIERGRNAAIPITGDAHRRAIAIFARPGARVVAVNDARVVQVGRNARLGRFVILRDVYGNRYTYGRLGAVRKRYALRGSRPEAKVEGRAEARRARRAARTRTLKRGAKLPAGLTIGRVGHGSATRAAHLLFEIRPAGRGAPRIDPKPILDGWKLLEATAIYRAKGHTLTDGDPTAGQVLLMGKEQLQRRVLADPRIDIYACGRQDVAAGIVDRRVLATLEFLAVSGLRLGVTSLRCGHSYYTSSGNVSHHTTGTAADIATLNGIPVLGHQGEGSITDMAVRRLLTLQGINRPDQIITLMQYANATNTLALPDHDDHIHVGFRPLSGDRRAGAAVRAILDPQQWERLVDRIAEIENPTLEPGEG